MGTDTVWERPHGWRAGGEDVRMVGMFERLSRAEIRKDAVQATVEAAATTVGQVTGIVATAVKDVAGALGGFATEVFEIRESSRRAAGDGD